MRLSERLQWRDRLHHQTDSWAVLRHRVRHLLQQSLLSQQLEVANRERPASLVDQAARVRILQ